MSVLITGGAGFVGLNIAERLLAKGQSVVCLGLETAPPAAAEAFGTLPGRYASVTGDVRDAARLRDVLQEHSVDLVVHGAAITAGLAREAQQSRLIVDVNLGGTIEVLEAALQHGVRRVIHLSSGSVFGASVKAEGTLDEEADIPVPDSLYGITKYAAERVALRYRTTRGMDVVAARVGVAFGRWEYDTSVRDTLSIPLALGKLAEAGMHAALYERIPDDWVYATDVADAIVRLLEAPFATRPLYHVGTGRRWSAVRWCDQLRAAHPAFSYSVVSDPAEANVGRQTPVPRPPFSVDRLARDLGFHARFDEESAFADYSAWRGRSARAWP